MTEQVKFHRMLPQDYLLTNHDPFRVWCLAEPSQQYLIFSPKGEPFTLHLQPSDYNKSLWIDAKTGQQKQGPLVKVANTDVALEAPDERRIGTLGTEFVPPSRDTDWVLILKSGN